MTATAPTKSPMRYLPVHQRDLARADGSCERTKSVYCESRNAFVPMQDCMECGHMFALDRSDRATFLVCRDMPAATVSAGEPAAGRHLVANARVAGVMSTRVACVHAGLGIDSLVRLLLAEGISGAPVVDADNKPIGVVTKTDLLRVLEERSSLDAPGDLVASLADAIGDDSDGFHIDEVASLTVQDIMSPLAFTVHADVPLGQAAAIMAFEGVHRVPVVDAAGKVIGLLSSMDVMRWLGRQSGYVLQG